MLETCSGFLAEVISFLLASVSSLASFSDSFFFIVNCAGNVMGSEVPGIGEGILGGGVSCLLGLLLLVCKEDSMVQGEGERDQLVLE